MPRSMRRCRENTASPLKRRAPRLGSGNEPAATGVRCADVDRSTRPSPALYVRGRVAADRGARHAVDRQRCRPTSFPSIDIPVVSVIWSYGGLSPTEMQDRITTVVERAMTTTVSNIEHMESQSVRGNSVIKLYFQPGADVNAADRAGDGDLPDADPAAAARHHAAADPAIQRRRRAGDHAQPGERRAVGAGDQRSRQQLHPHAAGGGPGRGGAAAVWRQVAGREHRSRPRRALRARPLAGRRSTPRSRRRTSSARPARPRWGRSNTTSPSTAARSC